MQGLRYPLFRVLTAPQVLEELRAVFASGYTGQGQKVAQFERQLASRLSHPWVLTTNSATSALHLALHMLRRPNASRSWPGLTSNDEVLTTALTCVATNWPILANGLRVRWADIDPSALTIQPKSVVERLTERTRVIIAVHWGGTPVDLAALETAARHAEATFGTRPAIVEDCAHAFGATLNGQPIGVSGNYCVFSFQSVKTLSCGDGGALVLNNSAEWRRARRLRWYGIDRDASDGPSFHERNIDEWGFKFHMNDVNAAIGLANLHLVDRALAQQRENAATYQRLLANVPGIRLQGAPVTANPSFYLYTVMVEQADSFRSALRSRGIESCRVHRRNDLHSCVRDARTSLPNLDSVYDSITCLPVGWWLDDSDIQAIVNTIRRGW